MRYRRLGRLGHDSSVIIYGAAMLSSVTQEAADASIAEALAAGINHIDVAAGYGDAELRLGPRVPEIRDRIFLATKTGERAADAAWREINTSLERLRTDRLDLIQIHAVCDVDELDKVTAPGGALEAVVRARDEGLAGGIGITGHGAAAPATHLEALRRYDFDTVLTPLNHFLVRDDGYRRDFDALAAETTRRDIGLMTIKGVARRAWPEGAERTHTTWYEPFDDPRRIAAAVTWLLSHEAVTGIATASDVRLLRHYIAAESTLGTLSPDEVDEILNGVTHYASPFEALSA